MISINKRFYTIISCFILLLTFTTFTNSVHAQGLQVGVVQGLVSGPDHNALSGANVSVECNGITKNTTSDSSGYYSVQFPNQGCISGQTVNVTATRDGQTGGGTGTMQSAGTIGMLTLDIAVIHVPVVPEFGLVTGGIALLTSAGSYIAFKRKIV